MSSPRPYAWQESPAPRALPPAFPFLRTLRLVGGGDPPPAWSAPDLAVEPADAGARLWALRLTGPDGAFVAALEHADWPAGWAHAVRAALWPKAPVWEDADHRDLLGGRPLRGGPRIMGILNITPDSFSDGGRWLDAGAALEQAHRLVAEGADILDVGGESTRPGAAAVDEAEELRRVLPVLERIAKANWPGGAPRVSIDTRKPAVAAAALDAGATILNDITGLRDETLADLAAQRGCPVILMHMRGEPSGMNALARYEQVVDEVVTELMAARDGALARGIRPERILLDPGIGFAKTSGQGWLLLRDLPAFLPSGHGLLLGASRKTLLGDLLSIPVDRRDRPSATLHALAAIRGAAVLRVHDVAALREALTLVEALGLDPHAP